MNHTLLFLLPGWGMPSAVWQPLLPALENWFQPVCADWRDIHDVAGFDRYVASLLADHAGDRFSIMGWSLGSLAALRAAALFQERVKHLVLFGATSRFVRDDRGEQQLGWPKRMVERMKRQLLENREQTLDAFYHSMFSGEEIRRGLDRRLIGQLQETNRAFSTDQLAAGLDYLMQADAADSLPEIRSAVLLIHGEADPICPVDGSRRIASRVSGPVRVEILPDTGHVPFYTQPERCLSAIREMVKYGDCENR
ncbi:alpha/beta fold hydrolase [Effusibacillus pohliae]|uniref:alpha/beta fold hydrolase n=1 Tax=Effusibacillus pohliae TaxID=232270 RepID=UPI00037F181D|nr:alpha/beta hydrolase [Effusibacillus pohliae]